MLTTVDPPHSAVRVPGMEPLMEGAVPSGRTAVMPPSNATVPLFAEDQANPTREIRELEVPLIVSIPPSDICTGNGRKCSV